MKWLNYDSFLWDNVKLMAENSIKQFDKLRVYASDKLSENIDMWKYSAIRAGVDKHIKFSVCNIKHFRPLTEKSGFIITNPPYGERIGGEDEELEFLYDLIYARLEKLYNDPRIHRCKMRVKAIGRTELLPESIKEVLVRLDNVTKNYDNYFLNIALAYGGQYELVDAVKKIGEKIKHGNLDIEDITKKEIESNLYTSHLPQSSPDMILRTSGEKRLSGFLIWQSAYSELVFMDIFWPEFRKIDLMRAIRTFQERKRRLGK